MLWPGSLAGFADPIARILRRKVINETDWTMRRHHDGRRHALVALFLTQQERKLREGLTDLLIEVVHKIGSQGQNRVFKAFVTEVKRVHSKEGLLVRRISGSRRVIRPEDGVPLDGVVPPKWRALVVEKEDVRGSTAPTTRSAP